MYNKRPAKVHGGSVSGVLRRHFDVLPADLFDVDSANELRYFQQLVFIYFYPTGRGSGCKS